MEYHALVVVFEKAANVKLLSAANYSWRFMCIFLYKYYYYFFKWVFF